MSALFEFRGVGYRDILAIEKLSVPAGTLFCITGESGAGKSTFLKLMNNLITCDRGEVLFRGVNILREDPVNLRRRVVMVPQSPNIFPGTLLDNVVQACRFAQKPLPSPEQIEEQLAALGLNEALSRDTATLSGGEKQRLALTRSLLLNPEVLLLDEPTSALDEETGDAALQFLANLTGPGGKTVIMVTHARSAAAQYADYLLALHRGFVAGLEKGGGRNG